MHISDLITDEAVIEELGRRLEAHRHRAELTQAELAERAGVGRSTVQRIEGGGSIQLTSLLRLLRALGLMEGIEELVPAAGEGPLAALARSTGESRRMRVRHPASAARGADEPWRWGDGGPDA